MPARVLFHYSPHGHASPDAVREFADAHGYRLTGVVSPSEIRAKVGRLMPAAMVMDASPPADAAFALCAAMKREPVTSVVPVIICMPSSAGDDEVVRALEAGADEVLLDALSAQEFALRLRLAVARAERDVSVHPTTLLPGTVQIERDVAERIRGGEKFAVCYADLDHFKEFNDRYGYNHGDRVILILSRILREIVHAYSASAFVGHIGGDDFIFTTPIEDYRACCEEVISVFSELIPLQYTAEDRERGYFMGKDRRGETYAVPLMTLSIGVVTNEHRTLNHTAQISELATEMKSYAKTLTGSLFVVDRRTDAPPEHLSIVAGSRRDDEVVSGNPVATEELR